MKYRGETIAIVFAVLFALGLGAFMLRTDNTVSKAKEKGRPADATQSVDTHVLMTSGDPPRGPEYSKFTLVEFGDLACPNCAKAQLALKELLKNHPDLSLRFHHFPVVNQHPNALIAARAAEAAKRQHKFWEMVDALYTCQKDWADENDPIIPLTALAEVVGLDTKRFAADLRKNPDTDALLLRDSEVASANSVQMSPSFFLITPTRVWAMAGSAGLTYLQNDAKYWQ